MSFTRRQILSAVAAAAFTMSAPAVFAADRRVRIAVGGKALYYYLPISIAERLGYFKDEGLDVQIIDFQGGSRSLQAVVGGSADIVSGAFEHTICKLRARSGRCETLRSLLYRRGRFFGRSCRHALRPDRCLHKP